MKTCSFEGCDRSVTARGWCKPHYYQQYHGKPLKPLKVYNGPVECSFDPCNNAVLSRGLCRGHYQQWHSGRELAVLQRRTNPKARDDHGRKLCVNCGQWLDPENFKKASESPDGLSGRCMPCRRVGQVARQYNITPDQYQDMLNKQGGCCAICHRDPAEVGTLHVDHDHACCPERASSCGSCVRGLLCHGCNTAIGLITGDPRDWAESAGAYLKDAQ